MENMLRARAYGLYSVHANLCYLVGCTGFSMLTLERSVVLKSDLEMNSANSGTQKTLCQKMAGISLPCSLQLHLSVSLAPLSLLKSGKGLSLRMNSGGETGVDNTSRAQANFAPGCSLFFGTIHQP